LMISKTAAEHAEQLKLVQHMLQEHYLYAECAQFQPMLWMLMASPSTPKRA